MSAGPALTSRVAIVTGGAGGIGAAVVRRLRLCGAAVAVFDLDPSGGPMGDPDDGSLLTVVAAAGDDAAVRAGVNAVVSRFGGIDFLVNNAGIGAVGDVAANDDDEWHRVLDVNLLGMVRVTRAALPHLRRAADPAIVLTGSVVADVGLPRRALYSATKGAVHALGRAMAVDLLADGVRVNTVAPGTADTPWVGRLLAAADDPVAERAALEARQPHGRLIRPEEVATAIVGLLDPALASVTGTTVRVDAGLSALRPARSPD